MARDIIAAQRAPINQILARDLGNDARAHARDIARIKFVRFYGLQAIQPHFQMPRVIVSAATATRTRAANSIRAHARASRRINRARGCCDSVRRIVSIRVRIQD
ncbi:MAG: hypothetical protein M0R66_07090 [Candidatus Omnitrophica bacterium]|nr:hypothetical protein [Candidatus Omnitrophota bacterium]